MTEAPGAPKDLDATHPIAASWRPLLRDVVRAFAEGDYELARGLEGVEPVPPDIAAQNRQYVTDYGEILIELADESWHTSCAQWMGEHWDVLVDLCTANEGVSDLVLTGKMVECDGKPRFTAGLIYVP